MKIRYIGYTLNLFKPIAAASLTRAATANFFRVQQIFTSSLLHSPQYFQPGSAVTVRYTVKNVMSCLLFSK